MTTSGYSDGYGDTGQATAWRDGRPVYDRGDTVCVIGAGPSGLTAIKNLKEAGFGVDCYERETSVGGGWNYRHDRSPVYASTHLISSKPFTQFPDFPMPDDWPDYPKHTQLLQYFEHYADHFELRPHIWFGTEVVKVEPTDHGRWDVTTRSTGGYGGERIHRYAAVVIANGHNWFPRMPAYDGLDGYKGELIHSSSYKDAAQLRGRKVLVVGAGNTGCDIAVEAAQQANRCWHSTRRGYWYSPKYALGRPTDQVNDTLLWLRLPLRLRQSLAARTIRSTVGDLARFGLPQPDHKVYESHPIVNSLLVYYLGHGAIQPVPDIKQFHRTSVELTDGREIEPDLVVMATGYQPSFEFIDPELLGMTADGKPRLAMHAFPKRLPTLMVAGLLQPDSGVFPLVHWQVVTFARLLRLRDTAPAKAAAVFRQLDSEADKRWTDAKVRGTARHWFEVSHISYLKGIERLLQEATA
ncbi:flavin-containing monooxygenase [Allorhizocola rhizosphaerae]|uniref:flavin-containing monooxygenase n=1 Tax=Allorhizocola rhizosphaerae TaxID=1872709 RepID=UPI000E3C9E9D|nr:NAD(P)-binding domain-containing protein [Allorhizocola rhizosphaerae]